MEIKQKTRKMLEKIIRKLARMAEDEVRKPSVNSSIFKIPRLVRLADKDCKNLDVQDDIDHLQDELIKGNYQAGIGRGRLPGTRILYMRAKHGGRLYFIPEQEGYNIVAKSGKKSQGKVISELKSRYPKSPGYNRAA